MKEIRIKFDETSNYDNIINNLDLVRQTLLLKKEEDSRKLTLTHLKLHLNGKYSAYQEVDTQISEKCNRLFFDFRHNENYQREQLCQTEKADYEKLHEPILLDFEYFAHVQQTP